MGFLPLAIIVWMAAMLGWYVISKYFKSSDADKIKQRLMGVGKARKKAKEAKSGEQSVIQTQQGGNKFAQLLVEKYQLGPKMQLFLEQAGLSGLRRGWSTSCIMAFGAGIRGRVGAAAALRVALAFRGRPGDCAVPVRLRVVCSAAAACGNSKRFSRKRWSSFRAPCAPAMRFRYRSK